MNHKLKLALIVIGVNVYVFGSLAFILWRSMGGKFSC